MMNNKELELYVHIPFCACKCNYCDFLSAPADETVQKLYMDKLTEEIKVMAQECVDYEVTTIFIGGGTPSILKEEWIAEILHTIYGRIGVSMDAEITIEANPGTLTAEKLKRYRQSGINRLSLGLQSADEGELRELGRIHTFDSFLKSFERARQAGFTNINVDLMSALPGQTAASWKNTLKKTAMLKPEHISAYSLIIEEGTPFYQWYGNQEPGHPPLPSEDEEREMYYMTKDFLEESGYRRYEISNYARPGFECRHNVGYWTGVPYLGLGLGASSYMTDRRFRNEPDLKRYLSLNLEAPNYGGLRTEEEILHVQSRMEEFMFLGLRLSCGVSVREFVERFGRNIHEIYGDVIMRMEEEELLTSREGRIMLTDRGVDVSNYVMSKFLI